MRHPGISWFSCAGRIAAAACAVFLVCGVACGQTQDPEERHYNTAVKFYNAGQWEAALKKIAEREAVAGLSEEMRLKYMYAKALALEKSGKTAEAKQVYAAIVQKYPQSPQTPKAALAIIYMDFNAGDFEAALKGYAAIRQDGLSAEEKQQLLLMAAESFARRKDFAKAAELYRQALAAGAKPEVVNPKLFNAFYQLRSHKELVEMSAKGVAGVPADALAMARAEALLALERPAEAEAEARKVPKESEYSGRAMFTLAQALIRQNKLKDAAPVLEAALAGMQSPPAAAWLALAECRLADKKFVEAQAALEEGRKRAGSVPAAEQSAFNSQAALLRIRIAADSKDNKALIKAVADGLAHVPTNRVPEILYTRLYALAQEQDYKAVAETLKKDMSVLAGTPQEGPALLLGYEAHKKNNNAGEGAALLEKYITLNPKTAEATRARLELANIALENRRFAEARDKLKALAAAPESAAHLGKELFAEALYNCGLAAVNENDTATARDMFNRAAAAGGAPETAARALLMLGQLHAQASEFKQAAEVWRRALALKKGVEEHELRDNIARVLLASGDAAGARKEFEAAAAAAGGAQKLKPEAQAAWARAMYQCGDFKAADRKSVV